jgi:type III pantothenate kinase
VACFLAIDIGNSRVHAGLLRDGAVTDAAAWPVAEAAAAERHVPAFVETVRAAAPGAAAFVSVRPAADGEVCDAIRRWTGLDAAKLGAGRPIPVVNRTERPEQVGADRLVHALAAFARARGACVVAAFGTAVTIDAVAADGTFLGGAILPGLRVQGRALHDHCEQLPDAGEAAAGGRDAAAVPAAIGRNTVEAIRAGLVLGLAGAARRLIDGARRELGVPAPLLLTGGDAALLRDALGEGDVVPHLALEGIARACGSG